jgi:hypothetical protein
MLGVHKKLHLTIFATLNCVCRVAPFYTIALRKNRR